jgi:hypothetical protein
MPCGHTIHKSCLNEMREHYQWVLTQLLVSSLLHIFLNIFLILVFDCISDTHALSVRSQSVICQRFGRNWTWRLLLRRCLNHIKIKWSVLFFRYMIIIYITYLFSWHLKFKGTNHITLNMQVWILCNDCGQTSHVQFHFVAQKCLNCKSYNTRQTRGWTSGFMHLFNNEMKLSFHFTWFILKAMTLNAFLSWLQGWCTLVRITTA